MNNDVQTMPAWFEKNFLQNFVIYIQFYQGILGPQMIANIIRYSLIIQSFLLDKDCDLTKFSNHIANVSIYFLSQIIKLGQLSKELPNICLMVAKIISTTSLPLSPAILFPKNASSILTKHLNSFLQSRGSPISQQSTAVQRLLNSLQQSYTIEGTLLGLLAISSSIDGLLVRKCCISRFSNSGWHYSTIRLCLDYINRFDRLITILYSVYYKCKWGLNATLGYLSLLNVYLLIFSNILIYSSFIIWEQEVQLVRIHKILRFHLIWRMGYSIYSYIRLSKSLSIIESSQRENK